MQASILNLAPKLLLGQYILTNFTENRTAELWRNFRPLIPQIEQRLSNDLYSLEVFDESIDFTQFQPERYYQKWAAVEVSDIIQPSEKFSLLKLSGGLYASFTYIGTPANAASFYQTVISEWMPANGYRPDHRPFFAQMGEKYKHNHPESEEQLFFPIQEK